MSVHYGISNNVWSESEIFSPPCCCWQFSEYSPQLRFYQRREGCRSLSPRFSLFNISGEAGEAGEAGEKHILRRASNVVDHHLLYLSSRKSDLHNHRRVWCPADRQLSPGLFKLIVSQSIKEKGKFGSDSDRVAWCWPFMYWDCKRNYHST